MDIGLIDYDALLYPENFFPNIDIMKLSNYYKKERHITSLILNTNNLERYTKIFFRKENDDGVYPSKVLLRENCEYGGEAFSNNLYQSISKEVDNAAPDLNIYNTYFRNILRKQPNYEEKIKNFEKASYVRFSSNNVDCDLDCKKGIIGAPSGYVYIYDPKVLELKEAPGLLDKIVPSRNSRVLFTAPRSTQNISSLYNWCKRDWLSAKNQIYFTKTLLNKDIRELCEVAKEFKVKPLIPLCVDKNKTYTNIFLAKDFRISLNRVIYSMTNQGQVKFILLEEIPNKDFQRLYSYLLNWHNYRFGGYSLEQYIKERSKKCHNFLLEISKNDSALRELIKVVPKAVISKGGRWLL